MTFLFMFNFKFFPLKNKKKIAKQIFSLLKLIFLVKKKVRKIIEDDESDKNENQDPYNKKSLSNKNLKEKNNSSNTEYNQKNIDGAYCENNTRTNKNQNLDNNLSEIKYRDFFPNKTGNLNEINESYMNSVHITSSFYSNNNNYQKSKNNNFSEEKLLNVIIPKKILHDYPITYEEVKAKIKAYYSRKLLQKQRIQSCSSNHDNKPNEFGNIQRDPLSVKKNNDQVNSYNINSHSFEEKIKKKLGNNVAKNPVVEHFNNNCNIFNNTGLKKPNEHFGAFNPNSIIINSNNNYNNINLNIINKNRTNEADKNLIPKSI